MGTIRAERHEKALERRVALAGRQFKSLTAFNRCMARHDWTDHWPLVSIRQDGARGIISLDSIYDGTCSDSWQDGVCTADIVRRGGVYCLAQNDDDGQVACYTSDLDFPNEEDDDDDRS